MQGTASTRYSDEKLQQFKALIQDEVDEVKKEAESIKQRLDGLEHQAASNGGQSFGEDSKNHEQRSWLTRNYERLIKNHHELELALARIANKTYGVDEGTGELIDEQRLRAMLTARTSVK